MKKTAVPQKPQTKIQPVAKKAPDKIEELVKKHLANIAAAENTLKSALALLEKHKTKYPELEQYVENVSASDRSIQMLDDRMRVANRT
jgi:hypothetical protein